MKSWARKRGIFYPPQLRINFLQNQCSLLQPSTLPRQTVMPMNQASFNPLGLLSSSRMMPYDVSFDRRNMQMDMICDDEGRLLQASHASPGRAAAVSNRIRELDTLIAASRRGPSEQGERHASQASKTHPSFMR